MMFAHKRLKLRLAISLLVIVTVLCTALANWITSAYALKNTLAESYLDNNYKYASKLSISMSDLFEHMQNTTNALAKTLGEKEINQSYLDEQRQLLENYFQAIFIVNPEATIEWISPSVIKFHQTIYAGYQFELPAVKEAIERKQPYISDPYQGASGHQVVIVASPIFDESGKYKGTVAGVIFLDSSKNVFDSLLENNSHKDGSLVYVVDHQGHIIYHPDASKVNQDISNNEAVRHIMSNKSGAQQITDSSGEDYFTAYVYEENKGWGIIAQTPLTILNKPLHDLFKKIALQSFPVILVILIVSQFLINNLIRPINRLAKFSEEAIGTKKDFISFRKLQSKSHIYEIQQLYNQIGSHFELLNNQIQLDGLTGLANRRTFNIKMQEYLLHHKPFTLILLDLDNFKKINDTYGHLVGDDTLKHFAALITAVASEGDLCFRYGGEEFGIVLLDKNEEEAWEIAEQLRVLSAETNSPTGHPVTVSIGIYAVTAEDVHPETVIERADKALFTSKNTGKNKVTIYQESEACLSN